MSSHLFGRNYPAWGAEVVPPTVYTFTLTAGTDGAGVVGYDTGVFGTFGSMDPSDVEGLPIYFLVHTGDIVSFAVTGDVLASVIGKSFYINDYLLPPQQEWFFSSGTTRFVSDVLLPDMIAGNVYTVRIE